MISRWYTVNCDECGDAGPLAENTVAARAAATEAGWKRVPVDRARQLPGDNFRFLDICPRHDRTEP